MPKESFLFVPYHTGQQSLADVKLTNSDARSHAAAVSRQRRDNKRLKDQIGLQHLTTVDTTHAVAATPSDADTALFDAQQDGCLSPTGKSSASSTPNNEKVENRMQGRQQMRAMQFSWRAGNVSAELRISDGFRSEPFGYMPSIDSERSITNYFMQVISPVNQAIYAIFNVTNIYTTYWLELMQHEAYKPAGLAMVGAIMHRIQTSKIEMSQDVRSNQAKALYLLQKKYKDALQTGTTAADDIAIITVLALANLSKFLGDMRAYEIHRSSMKAMVKSRGGLDNLGHDGLVRCSVAQWDSFWVIGAEGDPLFQDERPTPTPVYPAFPLSTDIRKAFMRLPAGFQTLVVQGKISVDLIEVLQRTADATTDGVQAIAKGNMFHSEKRRHRDFIEACPCLGVNDSAQNFIEKNITLALLLYCANAFTNARSSTSLYGACRGELTRLLLQQDESTYSPPERECLYWICAVCVDSWRQSGPDSPLLPSGYTLLPVLKRMKNGFTSENILQRFFYSQELLSGCDRYLNTSMPG